MAGARRSATELARAVEETFGCALRDGYGMSEVGGGITLAPAATPTRGRVRSVLRYRQRAAEGRSRDRSAAAGWRTGRGRGPQPQRDARLSLGRLRRRTAVVNRDGWLSTGDVGYLERDGYLFLVDRKKELIIRSGYNVYPREVEEVLSACPGRSRGSGGRRPGRRAGEEVVALVVPAQQGAAWTQRP